MAMLNRDLLLNTMDALDTGVILLDCLHRVLHWNNWMTSASGASLEEVRGKALSDVFPGIAQTRLTAVIQEALQAGTASVLTHTLNPRLLPLKREQGISLLHNVTVQRAGSADEPLCILQVIDVTTSVERERLLRQRQNARYRAVVDTAADAIITTSTDGKIQWANQAAERQFGYAPGEMTDCDIDVLLEHGGAWPKPLHDGAMDARSSGPVEVIGLRRDGSTAFLELSTACWSSDRRMFITGIMRDIAPRQRAEGALRAAAAVSSVSGPALLQVLVREVAEGLGVGQAFIAELSDDDRQEVRPLARWCNGGVTEPEDLCLAGLPLDAIAASGFVSVPARVRQIYPNAPLLAACGAESFAAACIRGLDEKPIGIIAVLDGKPMTGLDTVQKLIATFAARLAGELERQRAEEALRRLNAELEQRVAERTSALRGAADELAAEMRRREDMQTTLLQSQKLEALGQLVGGVAHDFNNILAAILGSYQLIDSRVDQPSVRQVVAHGRRAAERAAELIRHLLAFARREELKPRAVMLADLIPGLQGLFGHAVGGTVETSFDVPDGIWPVLVDEHRLEVALLNLAVNARDAMPLGGRLSISASNRVVPVADGRFARPGDYVAITVKDDGSGMPPEILARATEPFFTTKETGKGTGLGLATVHGFVEQSGGRMFIESEVGEGTCIEIVLPRAAVVTEVRPAETAADGIHGDAVIMVVDDDDQVRPVTATFLRDVGYDVIEAASAEAALVLGIAARRLDVVLCDVMMPGEDGPTFAGRLRAERPSVPFIFMTGHADRRRLADEVVIDKPFSGPQLLAALVSALDRDQSASEKR